MKKLINSDGAVVGVFKEIIEQANGYLCDGAEYQFSVVGTCTIEDYDGELPDRRNPEDVAEQVREERDEKLVSSDWTQVLDAPVGQTAWATYRQALRDVPQQDGFPLNVIWPDEP
jgi:hypothetical protein